MPTRPSIFLLGPGFIGLQVLTELLHAGYPVTVLVRRPSARANLSHLGATTILGSLTDTALIRAAAAAADITINTASADHLPSDLAILDGLAARARRGDSSIYIHTSGCGALRDASNGAYVSGSIFDDARPETVDGVADDAPHRAVDLAILQRRAELGDKAKIAIVLPPLIYGLGRENRLSIQLPILTRFARKHGYAGFVGGGKGVWGHVHVRDLARGYVSILQWMERASAEEVRVNPYFFVENGEEYSWERCAQEIGRALYAVGRIGDPTPREIPEEAYGDLFGEWSVAVVGQNARNRASRLRALGWRPREKGTFESLVEDELPVLLAEEGEFSGYVVPVVS